MLQQHEHDRHEKDHPVLVERDDCERHEKVKMHLDDAAREMHHHRGRRQQADARQAGAQAPVIPWPIGDRGQQPDDQAADDPFQVQLADQDARSEQSDRVELDELDDSSVASIPDFARDRPAFRKVLSDLADDPLDQRSATDEG